MADIVSEYLRIKETAADLGVDPYFIAAIRLAENGAAGREFGVLSVPAPTYDEQLTICCKSVRNRLAEYQGNPLERLGTRVCYSTGFIRTFANRWAPRGAENDPNSLNDHWVTNVTAAYLKFVREGVA